LSCPAGKLILFNTLFGGKKMKQKLSPVEKELYQRTDEVLHYLWNPLGVSDIPKARDEYYSYLPQVFSLILKGSDAKEIMA